VTNLDERLGDLSVLTTTGEEQTLRSMWAERPAVLVLIRHFG
jgi:hypothetical protein